jgi:subtilisin family serine protease
MPTNLTSFALRFDLKKMLTKSLLLTVLVCQNGLATSPQKRSQSSVNKTDALEQSQKLRQSLTNTNYSEHALASRFASWGIDPNLGQASINLKSTWQKFEKKKDIVVAVVDTGIQVDHPFLAENLYVSEGGVSSSNYGKDFSFNATNINTPNDTHGHGTHVAGIIKSIFPEVKILALKYYNPQASGQANLDSTIKCLEYAVDRNVDIINYSGGGPEPSVEELRVLKKAEQKGILVIAAAGNEKSNIDLRKNAYYPASYGLSNIVTVGAHDQKVNLIPSSNYGKLSVDIAAPGHQIKSAVPFGGVGIMTGTSQATAFVTGVVALMKSNNPELKYNEVRNALLSSSQKFKTLEGKILGAGKVDALKAIELAQTISNSKKQTDRQVAQTQKK